MVLNYQDKFETAFADLMQLHLSGKLKVTITGFAIKQLFPNGRLVTLLSTFKRKFPRVPTACIITNCGSLGIILVTKPLFNISSVKL